MKPNSIDIIQPDDGHGHFRDGYVLKKVVPETARLFKRALVIGNKPLIDSVEKLIAYTQEINLVGGELVPVMTLFMTEKTTPEMILCAEKFGARAVKFMPKSRYENAREASTGALNGLTPPSFVAKDDLFAAEAEAGVNQCCHGEDPDMPYATREREFLPCLDSVARRHPRTRFILEHVSDRASVQFVKDHPNVYGSITVHHLLLTWDDVIGDHDSLCMPVAKTDEDRRALLQIALSGHPRFFFGSDSAPHPRSTKDKAKGSYGLYTAPVAFELLAQIFDQHGRLDRLENFVSKYFAEAYRLPQNTGRVELVREPWVVPDPVAEKPGDSSVIRPFWAGKSVEFQARIIA